MIRVQREDFDIGAELAALHAAAGDGVGAVATFLGLVRGRHGDGAGATVTAMTLEHYPGMTERALTAIEDEARRRWPLDQVLVIHRYGRLEPGERIVFVATSSSHRDAAFDACRFLMDWLKTKAPFWKLEEGPAGHTAWVEARETDDRAAERWEE